MPKETIYKHKRNFPLYLILLLALVVSPVVGTSGVNLSQAIVSGNLVAGQSFQMTNNVDECGYIGLNEYNNNAYFFWATADKYPSTGVYSIDTGSLISDTLSATVPSLGVNYVWAGQIAYCTRGDVVGNKFVSRIYHYYNNSAYVPDETPICDFEISPYPANPGDLLTLTDISTGGEPTGYGWGYQIPGGSWDNTSLGIGETAAYTLAYFGQYNFSHEVGNGAGTDTCWYPFWSGTNYTAWNVTPTIVGNLTTNITATNISGQFAPLNLTLIDKPFFKNQLDNMTFFGNYSSAWTGFIDNMTESVNVTFNEVENRINPFNFLTDLIMNSHNLFVVIFIPLLGYVSFPLTITSAVINIIPQPIQLLISLGLLVDLFFLVLRGPD